MRNLSAIDQPLIVNAVASGVAIAFLLGYPVFKYVKEINKMNQTGKSYIEIIFTTLLMHILFLLLLVGFATFMNVLAGDNTRFSSYAPKFGTAFIMGLYDTNGVFQPNANFWETWNDLAKITVKNNMASVLVIKSSIVVISLATTFLWLCLFVYPPFCIFFPMFLAIRKETQGNAGENTYLKRINYMLTTCLSFVLITYMHFKIASVYIIFQTSADFSFWDKMTTIWSQIF